jgi:Protein of unknown function (DUF4232)
MGMSRAGAVGIGLCWLLAACASPTPSPSPTLSPLALHSAQPSVSVSAATRSSAPITQSPEPSVPGSPILLDAGSPFGYTGDRVTLAVDATRSGSAGDPALPVSATVDFGDGSSGASVTCGAPAAVEHVYSRLGQYRPTVTAASICEPAGAPDLSFSWTQLLIFPSAPAASADWPACTTFQVRITGRNLGGAMGEAADLVRLQNVSSTACQLDGYPGLQLVAADGRLLPTTVHSPSDVSLSYLAPSPHRVALVPGGMSSFDLDYNVNPSGAANNEPYAVACPSAISVRVTLPGTDQYGTAALPMTPCGGVMRVSPPVPGATGFSF